VTKHADTFGGALAGTWRQAVGAWATSTGAVQCADVQGSTGKYLIDDALDVGGPDMYAEARILSTQVNSGSNTGPAIQHRASVVTGYQFAANLNDSHGAWRTVAGAETQFGSFTAVVASSDMLRVEGSGRTKRYKVNDALVAVFQDTTITDGQRGAVNGYNNAASGDLIRADDWEEGLLTDDLVAAFLKDWSAQVTGVGTTLTPTVPPQVATGDLLFAAAISRDAAQVPAVPAGEGWSLLLTASQTGLVGRLWSKRWGLGGQTDDTTPTLTIGSGTAGWGVVLALYGNPLHATRPWTSVASAVVASAQQSNASSTTVTCPAASGSFTNATVGRFAGSADDNALNAPNAAGGALIFGGAAFDSTDGLDFAQAHSVREDITVTTDTGTSTFTESAVGPDVSFGMTVVITIPTAGSAVTGTGQVTGTGSISGAGVRGTAGLGSVSGAGSISGTGQRGVLGAGSVSGTGSISASGARGTAGAGLVSGVGSIAGSGVRGVTGAGGVTGSGAVSAAGVRGVSGAGAVAGVGSVAATGIVGRSGAGSVTGAGSVSGAGVRGVAGAGAVTGVGAITASGVAVGSGTGVGQVTGTGTIAGSGVRGVLGLGVVSGVGAITGAGRRHVTGSGSVTGVGGITGRGQGVGTDVPSQGTYETGGRLVYDGAAPRVYDARRGRLIYDP
jgi:hypothetical protein